MVSSLTQCAFSLVRISLGRVTWEPVYNCWQNIKFQARNVWMNMVRKHKINSENTCYQFAGHILLVCFQKFYPSGQFVNLVAGYNFTSIFCLQDLRGTCSSWRTRSKQWSKKPIFGLSQICEPNCCSLREDYCALKEEPMETFHTIFFSYTKWHH